MGRESGKIADLYLGFLAGLENGFSSRAFIS